MRAFPTTTARLCLFLLACALTAGALSILMRSASATAAAPIALTADGAIAAIPDDVVRDFAIFRERVATPMPADIAAEVASPKLFRRNAELARRIDTPNGTGWVVPGDRTICVVAPDRIDGYGVGCAGIDVIRAKGNAFTMRDADGNGFAAIIATDDADVRLIGADRRSTAAELNNGVLVTELAANESVEVYPSR